MNETIPIKTLILDFDGTIAETKDSIFLIPKKTFIGREEK
jgi:phosphoglycolate phosphatase-like HAD superfamily hydrolase